MRRRAKLILIFWMLMGAGIALILRGYTGWIARSPESYTTSSLAGARKYTGDPLETLARLQKEHRLVDVHEHIESIAEAPRYIEAMDRLGIGKMLLMGSSMFTLTLDDRLGFTRYDRNNDQLMDVVERYPDRFEAWPTIDPLDDDKLEKFKRYVERGATGLKLYSGHGYINKLTGKYMFHPMAMDDPRMFPVYEYCQENFIPVCIHVQPSPLKAPGFAQEFVEVLKKFPDLKIDCPHFMLSSNLDLRLRELLDTFPNLYSDVGVGDSFVKDRLVAISNRPAKYRDIFHAYPDRFMFSADLVLTNHEFKNVQWIVDQHQAYLDMLTKKTYTTRFVPGQKLNGLALPGELVERILCQNYEEFVAKRPRGTVITREISWSKMGRDAFKDRKPGGALPPLRK